MNSTEEYLDGLLKGMTEGSEEEDTPIEDTPIGDLLPDDLPLQEFPADESISEEGQLLEDEDIAALLKSMGESNRPPEEAQDNLSLLEPDSVMNAFAANEGEADTDVFSDSDIEAVPVKEPFNETDAGFEEVPGEDAFAEPFQSEELFSADEKVQNEGKLPEEGFLKNDAFSDEGRELLSGDADLLDLLAGMSDDAELSEISELLSKNDNHEMIEHEEASSDDGEMPEEDFFGMDTEEEPDLGDGEQESSDTGRKGKKKQRVKKEKQAGFFSRLFNTLSQEVEEPEEIKKIFAEETAPEIARQGAAENERILNKLDEEEDSQKKGKKAKKEKKVKEKPVMEPLPPIKRLPKKKVVLIGILCFSLGVIMTLLTFAIPYYSDMKNARAQFEQQNYEQAYELLRGHELNEDEQLMYDRSLVLLKAERKYNSYKNYMLLGMKLEALNALIQGIKVTEALSGTAAQLGVQEEFDTIRNKIITELETAFAVSLEQAFEWLQIEDNQVYSKELDGYVNGTSPEENAEGTAAQPKIPMENAVIKGEEEEFAPTDNETEEESAAAAAPIENVAPEAENQTESTPEAGNDENKSSSDSEVGRSTQSVEELNENVTFDMEGAEGL